MTHLDLFIAIGASWLVAWLYKRNNLSILGLQPTSDRLTHAAILFIAIATCCALGFVMRICSAGEQYAFHPQLSPLHLLTGLWDTSASVLFEELLFRGVALYILVRVIGAKWAICLTATLFGLFHVSGFSGTSAILFAYTFCMGLLLAYAFVKTESLYYPIAIHLGWNLVQTFVFPDGPYAHTLLVLIAQPEVTVSYFTYYAMTVLPKVYAILFGFLIVWKFSVNPAGSTKLSGSIAS